MGHFQVLCHPELGTDLHSFIDVAVYIGAGAFAIFTTPVFVIRFRVIINSNLGRYIQLIKG